MEVCLQPLPPRNIDGGNTRILPVFVFEMLCGFNEFHHYIFALLKEQQEFKV